MTTIDDDAIIINCVSLNQTNKMVTMGTDKGFLTVPYATFEKGCKRNDLLRYEGENFPYNCGVNSVSQLYDTALFALVTDGTNPRHPNTKVCIFNSASKLPVVSYTFCEEVKKVVYNQ